MPERDEEIGLREAMQRLGKSEKTVRRMIADKKLTAHKAEGATGREWRIVCDVPELKSAKDESGHALDMPLDRAGQMTMVRELGAAALPDALERKLRAMLGDELAPVQACLDLLLTTLKELQCVYQAKLDADQVIIEKDRRIAQMRCLIRVLEEELRRANRPWWQKVLRPDGSFLAALESPDSDETDRG